MIAVDALAMDDWRDGVEKRELLSPVSPDRGGQVRRGDGPWRRSRCPTRRRERDFSTLEASSVDVLRSPAVTAAEKSVAIDGERATGRHLIFVSGSA